MPAQVYNFLCDGCGAMFERRIEVDHRDLPQVCAFCGNGGRRLFTPATVLLPWTFNECMISDVAQTYEQAKAQDAENERYLANKPKEKPSFEQCMIRELDDRGIRHPHRLIEP